MAKKLKKSEIYKEKGENLASKVPVEIANEFRKQAAERANLKKFLAAAADLWTYLPEELQAYILGNCGKNENLYELLVNWIRDDQISQYLSGLSEDERNKILLLAKKAK